MIPPEKYDDLSKLVVDFGFVAPMALQTAIYECVKRNIEVVVPEFDHAANERVMSFIRVFALEYAEIVESVARDTAQAAITQMVSDQERRASEESGRMAAFRSELLDGLELTISSLVDSLPKSDAGRPGLSRAALIIRNSK
jgi:hypothetical protein